MILVSQLAPVSLTARFNELWQSCEAWADNYNLEETKDFVSFIVRTPNMRDNKFLIVDLSENNDHFTKDNVLQGIHRLQSFTTVRPIFILDDSSFAIELAASLAEIGVRNVIHAKGKDDDELVGEMRECISENGKGFTDTVVTAIANSMQQVAIAATQVKLTMPKNKILQVAVAGVKSCIGVSTQCVSISGYLYEIGLKPLIITFDTVFYEKLKMCFELKENIMSVLEIEQTHISLNIPTTNNYNAIVYDFGKLSSSDIKGFLNADISIVMATAHAWDLGELSKGLTSLNGAEHDLWLNFASKSEVTGIEKWDKLANSKIARLPFQPDPFKIEEITFYHSHLLPAIRRVADNDYS